MNEAGNMVSLEHFVVPESKCSKKKKMVGCIKGAQSQIKQLPEWSNLSKKIYKVWTCDYNNDDDDSK